MDEKQQTDFELAAEMLSELLPAREEQVFLLSQLLESVAQAERVSPTAWAVTLFNNGFRLNVGQVEVLCFIDGELRVYLHGSVVDGELPSHLVNVVHKSVPQPQFAFRGSVREFMKRKQEVIEFHNEFIQLAALSPKGKPRRGTSFARTHSEGLIEYVKSMAQSGV